LDKVQRVLDVYRTSSFGMSRHVVAGEITACSAYVAAQKLENAGDFKRAAIEYEKVLMQSGSGCRRRMRRRGCTDGEGASGGAGGGGAGGREQAVGKTQ